MLRGNQTLDCSAGLGRLRGIVRAAAGPRYHAGMMGAVLRAILLVIIPAFAWAQTITPAERPVPRMRVYADPAAIARNLLSPSEETRRLGYRQLGVSLNFPNNAVPEMKELRLLAANLDDDQELERVLVYSFERRRLSAAHVFDFDGKAWWCVGEFDDQEGSELIELKGATTYYHDDLVVRVNGHGTGFMSTELSIYRLWQGRLHRVFRTTERDAYDTTDLHKTGEWREDRRRLLFPVREESGGSLLIVHLTRMTQPDPDKPRRTQSLSCIVYRWHGDALMFRADERSRDHWCDPATREPRAGAWSAIE